MKERGGKRREKGREIEGERDGKEEAEKKEGGGKTESLPLLTHLGSSPPKGQW